MSSEETNKELVHINKGDNMATIKHLWELLCSLCMEMVKKFQEIQKLVTNFLSDLMDFQFLPWYVFTCSQNVIIPFAIISYGKVKLKLHNFVMTKFL